jgi:hypothetical protein
MAVVPGVAEPYLVTDPTESAFVPNALSQPYLDMLRTQQASPGVTIGAAVRPMSATAAVSEVHRIYDGKLSRDQSPAFIGESRRAGINFTLGHIVPVPGDDPPARDRGRDSQK